MEASRFGPYDLVRPIASGGMAELFLAKTREQFEKYLALKVIQAEYVTDETFVEMLIQEAKLAVQLQHENIVQTFDLGREGGIYYIAMEFIDGIDAYKLLRYSGENDISLPPALCAYLIKETLHGLDYAHRKVDVNGKPLRIVHRDISPQNILLSRAGEVKLADFGIAKAASSANLTAAGTIKGKYYYMSPEQASGEPLDARSDLFSMGIVLYELLAGRMLFVDDDLQTVLRMVRKAEIPPLSQYRSDVPRVLENIVMKALARRREDRFQTATEFARALESFLRTTAPFNSASLSAYVRKHLPDPLAISVDSIDDENTDAPRGESMLSASFLHERPNDDRNSLLFEPGDRRLSTAVERARSEFRERGPVAAAPSSPRSRPDEATMALPSPVILSVPSPRRSSGPASSSSSSIPSSASSSSGVRSSSSANSATRVLQATPASLRSIDVNFDSAGSFPANQASNESDDSDEGDESRTILREAPVLPTGANPLSGNSIRPHSIGRPASDLPQSFPLSPDSGLSQQSPFGHGNSSGVFDPAAEVRAQAKGGSAWITMLCWLLALAAGAGCAFSFLRMRAAQDVGVVEIVVTPADALVVIDGQPPVTAGSVTLKTGSHRIEVSKLGFVSSNPEVMVNRGETMRQVIELMPEPKLTVIGADGAKVFVDNKEINRAPFADQKLVDVIGKRAVRVEWSDGRPVWRADIDFTQTPNVTIEFPKLPEAEAVVVTPAAPADASPLQ